MRHADEFYESCRVARISNNNLAACRSLAFGAGPHKRADTVPAPPPMAPAKLHRRCIRVLGIFRDAAFIVG